MGTFGLSSFDKTSVYMCVIRIGEPCGMYTLSGTLYLL